ncbi:MAG: PLP-dependent aminotransferase family protein [Coriobacteriales bacterium]|jgi:2-aminoadipate transaminase|nr:PLP-dependent aminotransferase family protein [Coriobacteriales bacterium]
MQDPGLIQFDDWQNLYASRMESMRTSAVRDLFAAASRSDIISLSGGMPDIRNLPLKTVSKVTADAVLKEGVAGLQYGNTTGREETKQVVCRLMKDFNIEVTTADVTITSGGQQALDLIGKAFIDKGDIIITEGPTYLGALQAFSAYEPAVVTIPFDDEGMQTDLLEAELARLAKESPTGMPAVKFIYTIPNFQNPGGVTMSLARRKHLLELANRYKILVVEDDPYGRVRFLGTSVPALRSMDDKVIYLSTVSKVFAPGLRTGWIIAPRPILAKINLVKQGTDLCGSALNQVIVEHYFNDTDWQGELNKIIELYRVRREAMLKALQDYFPPEATWTRPEGGLFVWATLPDCVDTPQLLSVALEKGVTFVPGDGCYPGGSGMGRSSMRLAFCYEEPESIREAIRRLGEVIEERMELYRTFAAAGVL